MKGKMRKRKEVEKKEPSYIESKSKEELLQHLETDLLEQGEGRIFVKAGAKCTVQFEVQPLQNRTRKYRGIINQVTICPCTVYICMKFSLLPHSDMFLFYLLHHAFTHAGRRGAVLRP